MSQAQSDGPHRDVLPIPDGPFAGVLPYDAKDPDASFPAIEPLRPPAGAPTCLSSCSTTSASPPPATDKAIKWTRQQQKSLMPDKPFFMYFAPGATHAPHHVPAEWSAARRSGGQLIATGRIPIQAIIASIEADSAPTSVGA